MFRLMILLCISYCISGCSVAMYTPLAAQSALGLDTESLSDSPKYKHVVGKEVVFQSTANRTWFLRKFSGGRYFIELSYPESVSTEVICDLTGKSVKIIDIYKDKINGGVFYSANVECESGSANTAGKNRFYDEILTYKES